MAAMAMIMMAKMAPALRVHLSAQFTAQKSPYAASTTSFTELGSLGFGLPHGDCKSKSIDFVNAGVL